MTKPKMYFPLMMTAAGSVTALSLVGIATMTGLMPTARSQNANDEIPAFSVSEKADVETEKVVKRTTTQKVKPVYKTRERYVERVYTSPRPRYVQKENYVRTNYAQPVKRQPTGLGLLTGAAVGGLAGSQIGNGNGKTAATILGATGGAYLGNQIESGNNEHIGTAIGGVTGAALGSQVGKGNGRTAAAVLGAVGGAYLGHEIQKRYQLGY